MKRIVSIVVLVAVVALGTGEVFASGERSEVPIKGTEGPDIRAKVEPKGVEGPDIRTKVAPKGQEGPGVR
ncbi:MAG: hypothetical protein A2Z31_02225 [candidate division NC10 bacterium RBG_16_65_8]|nr:MAG: hypothetical protein A2Z31_02225 [candidate division NC10 bacterium RBG_16_65_8]